MSKQMTREEAVQAILDAVTELGRWSVPNDVEEAIAILAPEPRTEPPGVDEVGDGYGDEDEAWAYDSVFEAYIKRRGKVIRAHWGQHFNAWLPIEALPMPKGGADESEAMATKTWICYEIHRPNIPVHGCKTQCKECAERDTKALGMEGGADE